MANHECREDRTCRCSIVGLEPNEKCPTHGAGEYPKRCGECGRFLRTEEN